MDNLNDLKAIWLTAKTDTLPGSAEMARIVKKHRNQKLLKTSGLIFAALLLVGAMVSVVFEYRSKMITTRIGEALIIAAGIILIITNLSTLSRFYKLTPCSNKEFIQFLEHTRLRRLFYYKWTQAIALSFCSAGLLFYIYEGVHQQTGLFISSYAAVVLYLLVMWLYVRPRVFKKQWDKLSATIERLEKISKQL